MDGIASVIAMVVAVSVAVERVTEILKQVIPGLAQEKTDAKAENMRKALLQVLAGAVGTVIAWQGNLQLGPHAGWAVYPLIGAMSSGGSSFWNHVLDAVRATKIQKQAEADEKSLAAAGMKAAAARIGAAPAVT